MDILVLMPTDEGRRLFKKSLASIKTENNYKVVQCGIGKVESAISTTMELMNRQYDLVVLSGFCGSANNQTEPGMTAIPSKCVCYDFFNSNFNEEIDTEFATAFGDGSVMLTGDQFANSSTVSALKSRYKDLELYFDMESSSVCQACQAFNVRPLVIKLVADHPENGDTIDTFREFVKNADFGCVLSFIENFDKDVVLEN